MKRTRLVISALALSVLLVGTPLLAQGAEDGGGALIQFLFRWLPFLLVIALWIYFMRRVGGKKIGAQVERSFQHMDRLERQNDEILATLQRIEGYLRK